MSEEAWLLLIAIMPIALVMIVAMVRGYAINFGLDRYRKKPPDGTSGGDTRSDRDA